jgi:hypothetical protein
MSSKGAAAYVTTYTHMSCCQWSEISVVRPFVIFELSQGPSSFLGNVDRRLGWISSNIIRKPQAPEFREISTINKRPTEAAGTG